MKEELRKACANLGDAAYVAMIVNLDFEDQDEFYDVFDRTTDVIRLACTDTFKSDESMALTDVAYEATGHEKLVYLERYFAPYWNHHVVTHDYVPYSHHARVDYMRRFLGFKRYD